MGRRIVRDNQTLLKLYEELGSGDVVVGRVRMRPGEELLLLDLTARSVHFIPSALAQVCSRSKVLQARLLGRYMVPGTRAIHDWHDLMEAVSFWGREGLGEVVCKLDRANGGQGILWFQSIEEVVTQAVLGALAYPFVVQPFIRDCCDVRVVLLGETVDAYERYNPDNFRHNLHCGGVGRRWQLSGGEEKLCREVMARAGFPYAHVDLLVSGSGEVWLSEINLRGGLRGSRLTQDDYNRLVAQVHEELLAGLVAPD